MYTSIAGSEGRHIGVNAHAQIAYMVTEFGKNIYQEIAYKVTRINPLSQSCERQSRRHQSTELLLIKRETEELKEPCRKYLRSFTTLFQNLKLRRKLSFRHVSNCMDKNRMLKESVENFALIPKRGGVLGDAPASLG